MPKNSKAKRKLLPLDFIDVILARLENGEGLIAACRTPGFPSRQSVLRRVDDDPVFADKYMRARIMGFDAIAEDILRIADEANDSNKARVQIDARKWALSKLRPEKYGDMTRTQITGPKGDDAVQVQLNVNFLPPKKDDEA